MSLQTIIENGRVSDNNTVKIILPSGHSKIYLFFKVVSDDAINYKGEAFTYSITTSHKSTDMSIPYGVMSNIATLLPNANSTVFIDVNRDQAISSMLDGVEYTFTFESNSSTGNTINHVWIETE